MEQGRRWMLTGILARAGCAYSRRALHGCGRMLRGGLDFRQADSYVSRTGALPGIRSSGALSWYVHNYQIFARTRFAMSGHSKWATIKHKKAAADAKRGRLFTRLI